MDALSRQKSLMAATGAVIAMLGLVGCEKLQSSSVEADRAAVAAIAKGQLDAAAAEKGASPAIRTTVRANQSTQRYAEGVVAYSNVLDARLNATRLGWQATRLASMASQNLDSAHDLSQYDPAPSLLKADEVIGSIRGASDKMTHTVAGVDMPTLTAVEANIEKLNADIGTVEKQVAELKVEQQQLSQKSQDAQARARDLKGQPAVDAYKQAADATKQASDTAVKIELAQAKLVPLQQDLAVAQEQKTVLTASVAQVDSLKAKLNEGWDAIGTEKGTRTKIAETLIGKSPERNRVNLVTTVKDIEAVGRDGEKEIGKSEIAFKGAVDSAHEASAASALAAKRAGDLLAGSRGTSQEVVFKAMQGTFSPNSLKANEAVADYSLARVYADQASLLKTREGALNELASTAGRVNYSVPTDLPAAKQIATDQKEAAGKAAASLKRADENLSALDQLLQSGAGDIKQTVAVGRMMTLLSASEVARDMGNNEKAKGDAAKAKSYFDEADGYVAEAKTIRLALAPEAKLPELPAPLNIGQAPAPAPAPVTPVQPETATPETQPEAPAVQPE